MSVKRGAHYFRPGVVLFLLHVKIDVKFKRLMSEISDDCITVLKADCWIELNVSAYIVKNLALSNNE